MTAAAQILHDHAEVEAHADSRADHFVVDRDLLADAFDQRPFYIQHDLCAHPLFDLQAMAALSQRLHPAFVEWNEGNTQTYGNPNPTNSDSSKRALSCNEAILGIGERPAWVLLRRIEHDPLYKNLLDELLDEIEKSTASVRPGMRQRQAFLFISSRAAVTPYHFDPEHNFLLQMRGYKTVHMWDPCNREVLPEAALDSYYAGANSNRDQPYRDEFLQSAWVLPLKAGQGLHFPLHAPHWVKTESELSVSLAITFRSRHSKFQEAVRVGNGHVRKLGITPPAPRVSTAWDIAAHGIYVGDRVLRRGKKLFDRMHRIFSPNAIDRNLEFE